jgi:hypothetical protein
VGQHKHPKIPLGRQVILLLHRVRIDGEGGLPSYVNRYGTKSGNPPRPFLIDGGGTKSGLMSSSSVARFTRVGVGSLLTPSLHGTNYHMVGLHCTSTTKPLSSTISSSPAQRRHSCTAYCPRARKLALEQCTRCRLAARSRSLPIISSRVIQFSRTRSSCITRGITTVLLGSVRATTVQ